MSFTKKLNSILLSINFLSLTKLLLVRYATIEQWKQLNFLDRNLCYFVLEQLQSNSISEVEIRMTDSQTVNIKHKISFPFCIWELWNVLTFILTKHSNFCSQVPQYLYFAPVEGVWLHCGSLCHHVQYHAPPKQTVIYCSCLNKLNLLFQIQ